MIEIDERKKEYIESYRSDKELLAATDMKRFADRYGAYLLSDAWDEHQKRLCEERNAKEANR